MLILTAVKGDRHFITVPPSNEPTQVEVVLRNISGTKRVTIGYDAPQEVRIVRHNAVVRERIISA